MAGSPVVVGRVTVYAGRLVADIRCDPAHCMTDPDIAQAVRAARPSIARHACVNSRGPTFGCVMDNTPLPHLVEHLAVDFLAHDSAADGATFVGTSEWTDRDTGAARIQLSFEDDLEALQALKQAVELVNNIAGVQECRA